MAGWCHRVSLLIGPRRLRVVFVLALSPCCAHTAAKARRECSHLDKHRRGCQVLAFPKLCSAHCVRCLARWPSSTYTYQNEDATKPLQSTRNYQAEVNVPRTPGVNRTLTICSPMFVLVKLMVVCLRPAYAYTTVNSCMRIGRI